MAIWAYEDKSLKPFFDNVSLQIMVIIKSNNEVSLVPNTMIVEKALGLESKIKIHSRQVKTINEIHEE